MALEFIDYPDQQRAPLVETAQQAQKRIDDFTKLQQWGLFRAAEMTYVSRTQIQLLSPGAISSASGPDLQLWYHPKAFRGVTPVRVSGSRRWYTAPNEGSHTIGSEHISRDWQEFLSEYAGHFENPIAFQAVNYTAEQAGAWKPGSGPSADLPMSTFATDGRPTCPPDIGFRVIDRDGVDVLQVFRISEYRKAFPLQISVSLPPVVAVPAFVLRMRAINALNDATLTVEQQVDKAREILGGKPQVVPAPAPAI